MNARLLLSRLERSGVVFGIQGDNLSVDAPSRFLRDEDRAALVESKTEILGLLQRREKKLQAASERGFIATYSKYQGYILLHDPLTGEWHDFPSTSCLPSVVEEAKARARKQKEVVG